MRILGVLALLREQIERCWHEPDAAPPLAAAYRTRQYAAIIKPMWWSAISAMIVAVTFAFELWPFVNQQLLLAWLLALICSSAYIMTQAMRHTSDSGILAAPDAEVNSVVFCVAVNGLLFGSLSGYVYGLLDNPTRLVVTGVIAAMGPAGAWQFASLPLAALGWAVVLCVSTAVSLVVFNGTEYTVLVWLLAFNCVFIVGAVLVTSRLFLSWLKSETFIEQQKRQTSHLLEDFEQNASDWLWETDRFGHLRHVPAGLAQTMKTTPEKLLYESFSTVLLADNPAPDPLQLVALEQLKTCMARGNPFKGVMLPTFYGHTQQWWSIRGKPLLAADGSIEGWRGIGSDATALYLHEQNLLHLANSDVLTGLPNRNSFNASLAAFFAAPTDAPHPAKADLRPMAPCTLILLDLDNFKSVNDSYGHAAGDLLLQQVAKRLEGDGGPHQLVARLGGNEFALLVPRGLSAGEALAYGAQLLETTAQPLNLDGFVITVRASVGIAFAPKDARDAGQLLRVTDMALKAAKAGGRNTVCFFEPHMAQLAKYKSAILRDLEVALKEQQFILNFQPLVEFDSGKLVGFEALLRWHHPTRGLISPVEFIPLAEESGLIVAIGEWVMHQACRAALFWPAHIRVAVNVSPAQFANSEVVRMVGEALEQSGLPANRLEIEMTESALMNNGHATLAALRRLRDNGMRVVLDDFGTGYSSLSYLQSFPIDKLKIDRSFVTPLVAKEPDSTARAIVQTILQLARALDLTTTAEGVETLYQWEALHSMGCKQAQGYLVAKPMALEEVDNFIQRWDCVDV
jgi:diguanylate cyclase (GGDEF)-like protein